MAMAQARQQQSLLALIQLYSSERLLHERNLEELKSRNLALRAELESVVSTVEDAKSQKKSALGRLKGLQAEFTAIETVIQTRKAKIQFQQDEMAKAKNEIEAVEQEQRLLRDNFMAAMLHLNEKLRNMQQYYSMPNLELMLKQKSESLTPHRERANNTCHRMISDHEQDWTDPAGHMSINEKDLGTFEMQIEEQRKEKEALTWNYNEILTRKGMLEQRINMMEAILLSTNDLKDLSKQSAELESLCASVTDQLQALYVCPKCAANNIHVIPDDE